MYKIIFPNMANLPISAQYEGHWLNAHNDWLQVLFEMGMFGFITIIGFAVSLLKKCRGIVLFGAVLVMVTLTVHFPMRTTQIVPLLILFVAYVERIQYVSSKPGRDNKHSARSLKAA